MSGESLRAMIVRERCRVTVVFSGGGASSSSLPAASSRRRRLRAYRVETDCRD
jgi:hypothetical protein